MIDFAVSFLMVLVQRRQPLSCLNLKAESSEWFRFLCLRDMFVIFLADWINQDLWINWAQVGIQTEQWPQTHKITGCVFFIYIHISHHINLWPIGVLWTTLMRCNQHDIYRFWLEERLNIPSKLFHNSFGGYKKSGWGWTCLGHFQSNINKGIFKVV